MAPAAADPITRGYHEIETDRIESSGLNPRTHWDKADDRELEESIRAKGVLEPIIARPHPKKDARFQIVAGERRFRAASAVGLGLLPAVVREVSDEELLELALAENIQRRSMHPLDEAQGFIKRLEMGQSSPEQLAAALGLSPRYVRDRIRLTKLSAGARKMLETGEMTVSHAIVLAKLEPKLQDEALEECTDYSFDFDGGGSDGQLQPVAVLKRWVADNVPLNPASPEAQEEFPQLAEAATEAAAKGATVVMLSTYHTPYQHKAAPDDPLFADKWQECKKTDKAAQIGVVVEGHRRGDRIYFKPPTPAKRESSPSDDGPQGGPIRETKAQVEARKKREAAAEKRQREVAAFWNKNKAAALEAYGAHLAALPIKALLALASKKIGNAGKATTADEFLRNVLLNRAKNSLYSVDGLSYAVEGSGFNTKAWLATQMKNAAAVHKLHPKKAKAAKKGAKR